MSRESLNKKLEPASDPKLLKKLKQGNLELDEFAKLDVYDKRKLKLVEEGLFVDASNIVRGDKLE